MQPILIAHRCGPDVYPEQSIASARHALSLGADFVEMDIQYTCDGIPVICHDPNVERIFGMDKLCSDMTLNEFMTLRPVEDRSYPSHSLEDVLSVNDVRPILFHCKISGEPLKDLVSCIERFNFQKQCVIGVQYAQDVELVKTLCPDIGILAFMPRQEQMQGFLESRCEIIRLWEDWVTEQQLTAYETREKRFGLWRGNALRRVWAIHPKRICGTG